ncbi:MAG: AzlC family ABC transporter permease [Halolamina sp.]|uniref:AzlC family ABC transporter permease n=1 Tax=Halolamina sp. TaxID=1940283 RepID=UPI002FC2AB86
MRREDILAGIRAFLPLAVGVVPFALIAGITAVDAGIPPYQAVGMSVILFAGASQLAAIELLGGDAPLAVVVLTAVVINLRFTMYSASIAPYFRGVSGLRRWLGAYILTDQAYALSVAEFRDKSPEERGRMGFYFGAAIGLWIIWQFGTIIGALLGATVPSGLSLEFAVPLTFLALLFPAIEGRPTAAAAVVAAGIAVLAAEVPFNLGLLVAAFVGIGAGVVLEHREGTFPTTEGELGGQGSDEQGAVDDADAKPSGGGSE